MNTLPATIRDPQFRGKALIDFLDQAQVSPDRIVIEITEKLVIENYNLFREAMAYFTDLGMSFAVDDVGAGYSGLESIARLKPHLPEDRHRRSCATCTSSLVNREMVKAIIAMGQRHRRHGHRGGHPDRGRGQGAPRHGRRLGPGLPAGPPRRGPRAGVKPAGRRSALARGLLGPVPASASPHLRVGDACCRSTRFRWGRASPLGDFDGDGRRDAAYGFA